MRTNSPLGKRSPTDSPVRDRNANLCLFLSRIWNLVVSRQRVLAASLHFAAVRET